MRLIGYMSEAFDYRETFLMSPDSFAPYLIIVASLFKCWQGTPKCKFTPADAPTQIKIIM